MAAFKEMDPEDIRKALEGQVDVLASEIKKEEAFFRNSTCPVCGGGEFSMHVNSAKPFTEGALLPNKILKCMRCSVEFEPYSRLVTSVPFADEDEFTGESD